VYINKLNGCHNSYKDFFEGNLAGKEGGVKDN